MSTTRDEAKIQLIEKAVLGREEKDKNTRDQLNNLEDRMESMHKSSASLSEMKSFEERIIRGELQSKFQY